ncbi:LOB domain-containing protein 28 [Hirschfeldia incana]|nr:LOB domain-containing protein 28 [Hirschfeldia incana]
MEKMSTPCAACKYLRRKCTQACLFAPYFPPNKLNDYTAIHKVFGASQVAKILKDLHPSQRQDAVNSLVYEAQALLLDKVHGCSLHICNLQRQLKDLQDQLQIAKNHIAYYNHIVPPPLDLPPPITYQQNHQNPMLMPAVSNYVGQITSQQLHEEAHRVESEISDQVQRMQLNAAQSK